MNIEVKKWKPKICSVTMRGAHRYAHEAVFGAVDTHPLVKKNLEDPPDFIAEMMGFNYEKNEEIRKRAIRIATIHHLYQNMLWRMIETIENGNYKYLDVHFPNNLVGWTIKAPNMEEGVRPLLNILKRMKSCTPAGVTLNTERRRTCGKTAVCPWCRYRKALDILDALELKRRKARKIAVIKLAQPLAFDDVTFELTHLGYKQLSESMIHGVMKDRDLLLCDVVTTNSNWYRVSEPEPGSMDLKELAFVLETTVVALLKKNEPLPLPENCLTPEKRRDLLLCGGGLWNIMKPTKKNLSYAMRSAFGFSPALLFTRFDPKERGNAQLDAFSAWWATARLNEYVASINLHSQFRTSLHGFRLPKAKA